MKIDRPGMAIIGAVLMFAFGALRPSDALHFVDLGTVVLLFSMMLLVAYLHVAGFFNWVTERVVAGLKPHHLLPTVIFLSGGLSQALDIEISSRSSVLSRSLGCFWRGLWSGFSARAPVFETFVPKSRLRCRAS